MTSKHRNRREHRAKQTKNLKRSLGRFLLLGVLLLGLGMIATGLSRPNQDSTPDQDGSSDQASNEANDSDSQNSQSNDSQTSGNDSNNNETQSDSDDSTSDEDASDEDASDEENEADDEEEELSWIKKLEQDIDTKFGEYVVTPFDAVVFYDLGVIWDVTVGESDPRPADEFWPEERKEALQKDFDDRLQAYRDENGGNGPESSEAFLKNVFDPNGGDGNPTSDEIYPLPAGFEYVYDAESSSLQMKGRPQFPFIVVWLLIGAVFFTVRMGFINIRGFWHAIRLTKGDYDDPNDPGEVSHFQALSSALSATVGLGNIAGVAIAIGIGGPGATFWMILIGLFGMSMKFNECTLGQLYRKIDKDGVVSGGPMVYLRDGLKEMGLGPLGVILAVLFSLLCIGASFGGGNAFQVNQSLNAINKEEIFSFLDGSKFPWIYGIVMAVMVGLVIVGGIKSIGRVAARIVPLMCGAYVLTAMYILVTNAGQIPAAFGTIIGSAFAAKAMYGGFVGCLIQGIRRAVFSNEAGAGSAAIAHSAAKTDEPVSEGIVALLEPFIDTVVVCTMTALVVVISNAYIERPDLVAASEGAALTSVAFQSAGFVWFKWILYGAVVLFAYSTMISWSYYGERCWSGLFGQNSAIVYKVIFLIFVVLGSVINATNVRDFSDLLILSMAFPNLLGGVILSGKVKSALDEYWGRYQSGKLDRK